MFEKNKVSKAVVLAMSSLAGAQALAQQATSGEFEEVVVTGIRGSLERSMDIKRDASGVVDAISAEDMGKFPDTNVAESLQRITGVSIDRSGGEGQSVTVRGFGPAFNTVMVNGRQMATENQGREFSFDTLSAELVRGVNVYKSSTPTMRSGGIGSAIDVSTARPFDFRGLEIFGSIKGTYESLNEETYPTVSGLISNTFADETFGVLLALSHSERENYINSINSAGYRPGLNLYNEEDDLQAGNVTVPRNLDMSTEQQKRTRTNANIALQYAPSEDVTVTFDGFHSNYEVDAKLNSFAAWFEPNRVTDVEFNQETRTVTRMNNIGTPDTRAATDFVVNQGGSKDVELNAFGLNVEWNVNESLTANFDISYSDAENDMIGKSSSAVIGHINSYTFDSSSGRPLAIHDGYNGNDIPDTSVMRMHIGSPGGNNSQDEINEYRADFEYAPEATAFKSMRFGAYRQEREKSYYSVGVENGNLYGGYWATPPDDLLSRFTAPSFFSGAQDTWYTFDTWALYDHMLQEETANENDINRGQPVGTTWQALQDGGMYALTVNDDRYTVNEDINSLYLDFTFEGYLTDLPWTVNVGARYAETTTSVSAVQTVLSDVIATGDPTMFSTVEGSPTAVSDGNKYSNLLPSINAKIDLQDDMVLRFARYDSLTRPTLTQLSPATSINEPRLQNMTGSGGNAELKPFTAENWDLSYEWYYDSASYLSVAYFNKEVSDFIVTLAGDEEFTLSDRENTPDNICATSLCSEIDADQGLPDELMGISETFRITRPRNAEVAEVNGVELAWTHVWDNGFGITLNATKVDSNATLSEDRDQAFALVGLGDSQNAVVFYERGSFQARVAFNNREQFLQSIDGSTAGEPIFVDTYGQWDISAGYDITDSISIFLEGVNVTEEELTSRGRENDQIVSIVNTGARYSLGLRARF
ncbi:TonB-dependent receptor [Marinimicrobium sp. ARAG 43.8]|uniref:TonB-dependent receptor n=1 Tax=Marinimicrobium sp. ARAG 43.8 TaxID=3418719 RepID=UPI003CF298FF